jgi:hypothetical protein
VLGAALVSLGLHAAMLALPLGVRGGQGFMQRDAETILYASFRPIPTVASLPPRLSGATEDEVTAAPRPEETELPPPDPAADAPAGTLSVAATYFNASQLTEIPRPLAEPSLEPVERLLAGVGAVRMTLYIDEWGQVTAIDVRSATLPEPVVRQAAAIFSHVPFSPGRIGRFAVKSQIGITVGAADAAPGSYANRPGSALQ